MGECADVMWYSYLVIFRMLQLIINVSASSAASEIAQKTMPLMEEPEIHSDLAFIECFHVGFFKVNLNFFMQSADLTKPGFQAHQTAVQFHIMDQRLKDLAEKSLTTDRSFLNFRKTLQLKDKLGKS